MGNTSLTFTEAGIAKYDQIVDPGDICSCAKCDVFDATEGMYFTYEPDRETFDRLWPIAQIVDSAFPLEGGHPICTRCTPQYKTWLRLNKIVNDRGENTWELDS